MFYAKTNRPILVPIQYLHCVKGGAAKFMYGLTFNVLYWDWMVDKLANGETTPEDTQILNQHVALQSHCNFDLNPRALAACLARDKEFHEFFRDADNRAPDFEFEFWTWATVLPYRARRLIGNNQSRKVNRTTKLHTIHNYLFVQHHFHCTYPLVQMNSRLQNANTRFTSPYYMN